MNPSSDPPESLETDQPCIGCGYDLRGTESGARCPECGAAQTAELTRRQAALVGARIVAVWLLLSSLFLLDVIVWYAIWSLFGKFSGNGSASLDLPALFGTLLQSTPLAVRAGLAALLWWQAPRLIRHLVPVDGPLFGGGAPTARDLLAVGLVILGVAIATHAVGDLIGRLMWTLSPDAPPMPSDAREQIAATAFHLVLGVLLAVSRPLHRRLAKGLENRVTTDA